MAGYGVRSPARTHHQRAFSLGEETHHGEFVPAYKQFRDGGIERARAVLTALPLARALCLNRAGVLIFLAILLHKAPRVHYGVGDAWPSGRPRRCIFLFSGALQRLLWPACW